MKVLNNLITMAIGVIIWNIGGAVAEQLYNEPENTPSRDYQIEIKHNKALVYDGQTFKGVFILFGQLDSLITKDNQ